PTPLQQRYSVGRSQPYDGQPGQTLPQAPAPPLAGQPQHTFFAPNRSSLGARTDFDWMVRLDRPAVSPMELLHAPCCKPHQLTHLFKSPLPDPYQSFNHAPYWLLRDPNSPLYRVFEFLETGCRAGGVAAGERIPGRINLNTVWDPEIFQALCDAQP